MKDASMRATYPIVDTSDRVIGFTSCKESMHKSKMRHRAIHIFIETFGGGFLLQKKGPNSENPNTWSSAVSGHVEGNEAYEDTAVREMKEELGLNIDETELEKICKISPCEETAGEFITLYTYLMDESKERLDPDPEEVSEIRKVPLKELILSIDKHRDLYSPAFVTLLNIYLELSGMKGES